MITRYDRDDITFQDPIDALIEKALRDLEGGSGGTTEKEKVPFSNLPDSELRQRWRAGLITEDQWVAALMGKGLSDFDAKARIATQKNVGLSTAASTRGQLTASEQAAVDALMSVGAANAPAPPASLPEVNFDLGEGVPGIRLPGVGLPATNATPSLQATSGGGGGVTGEVGPAGRTREQVTGTDYLSDAERQWYLGQSGGAAPAPAPATTTAPRTTTTAPRPSTAPAGTAAASKPGTSYLTFEEVMAIPGVVEEVPGRQYSVPIGGGYFQRVRVNTVGNFDEYNAPYRPAAGTGGAPAIQRGAGGVLYDSSGGGQVIAGHVVGAGASARIVPSNGYTLVNGVWKKPGGGSATAAADGTTQTTPNIDPVAPTTDMSTSSPYIPGIDPPALTGQDYATGSVTLKPSDDGTPFSKEEFSAAQSLFGPTQTTISRASSSKPGEMQIIAKDTENRDTSVQNNYIRARRAYLADPTNKEAASEMLRWGRYGTSKSRPDDLDMARQSILNLGKDKDDDSLPTRDRDYVSRWSRRDEEDEDDDEERIDPIRTRPIGLAKGGPAEKGRPYIIGEQGPELFVPKQSGTVVPNIDPIGPEPVAPDRPIPLRLDGNTALAAKAYQTFADTAANARNRRWDQLAGINPQQMEIPLSMLVEDFGVHGGGWRAQEERQRAAEAASAFDMNSLPLVPGIRWRAPDVAGQILSLEEAKAREQMSSVGGGGQGRDPDYQKTRDSLYGVLYKVYPWLKPLGTGLVPA